MAGYYLKVTNDTLKYLTHHCNSLFYYIFSNHQSVIEWTGLNYAIKLIQIGWFYQKVFLDQIGHMITTEIFHGWF